MAVVGGNKSRFQGVCTQGHKDRKKKKKVKLLPFSNKEEESEEETNKLKEIGRLIVDVQGNRQLDNKPMSIATHTRTTDQ